MTVPGTRRLLRLVFGLLTAAALVVPLVLNPTWDGVLLGVVLAAMVAVLGFVWQLGYDKLRFGRRAP